MKYLHDYIRGLYVGDIVKGSMSMTMILTYYLILRRYCDCKLHGFDEKWLEGDGGGVEMVGWGVLG